MAEGALKEAGVLNWIRNWWNAIRGKPSVDSLTDLEQKSPPQPEETTPTQMPTFGVPPADPQQQQDDAQLPTITRDDLGQILEDNQEGEMEDIFRDGEPIQEPLVEETIPQEQVQEEEEPQQPEEQKGRPPKNAPNGQKLIWAEQNRQVVWIKYTTLKNNVVTRVVEPHGRFYAKTTHRTIMVTFDETVGDVRAFVMTRIGEVRFMDQKFNKKFNVSAR